MESAAGDSGDRNSSSLRTLMFKDKFETPNLGDFLRLKENNNNNNNRVVASLTLGAVLSSNKREDGSSSSTVQHSNRTLLDIISEDPSSSRKTRKTWKHFRNKLRLKRENENSAPGSTSETLHRDENNEEEEESEGENAGEETGGGVEDQPVRMSLMALLEENEGDGSAYLLGDENEEEEEEEEVGEDGILGAVAGTDVGAGGEYNNCCVCMVRHKGAAFIPCGHTFCRLCSRELWVQRGNCPLCNNFILEVLDIF